MLKYVFQHSLDLVLHPDRYLAVDEKIRELDLRSAVGETVLVKSHLFPTIKIYPLYIIVVVKPAPAELIIGILKPEFSFIGDLREWSTYDFTDFFK